MYFYNELKKIFFFPFLIFYFQDTGRISNVALKQNLLIFKEGNSLVS